MPWTTRNPIRALAPVVAVNGISARAIDAAVKTAKPALYMRTRPKMSPMRPKVTTSTAVTTMYPCSNHRR
jgi:hypothetical protein